LHEKDSGNQAAANPDFSGVEFPRGRRFSGKAVVIEDKFKIQ
jgi:hypothetical protein